MWGEAVYNLIGFGKQSDDGDNIVDENDSFLLLDEADGTAITEDLLSLIHISEPTRPY